MMAIASPSFPKPATDQRPSPLPVPQLPAVARRGNRRRGAATVEFALIAPLVFVLLLGIIEFGRAMMVIELLNNAARNGCRVGVLDGSDVSAITTAVNDTLRSSGVSGATTAVSVNGTAVSATGTGSTSSMASTGDAISVTVSVPANSVSWLPSGLFLKDRTLAGT